MFFGASGDLTKRMLMPAMYNLRLGGVLPTNSAIIGFSRSEKSHYDFREEMKAAIDEFSRSGEARDPSGRDFANRLHYISGSFDDLRRFKALARAARRERRDVRHGRQPPVLPRDAAECVRPSRSRQLSAAGLGPKDQAAGWSRIVIEKPFGSDLESARALQAEVNRVFDEKQVYRIDHYLGKEPVQDIVALRFANVMFEPIWNRRYVDSVQITAAETVGVEGRGGYYEGAGALRDMIQNHVMNLLALVAMEPPISPNADHIRDEKFKVLSAVRPFPVDDVPKLTARGQYGPGLIEGKPVPGYREEPSVDPQSTTETYACDEVFHRQLALGRRSVLPAQRQAARPQALRDRGPLPGHPASHLRRSRRRRSKPTRSS